MAAFISRGFGRVHAESFAVPVSNVTYTGIYTSTITTGVPPIALPGATGFIAGDVSILVALNDATGCPCKFNGALYLDKATAGHMSAWVSTVILTNVGDWVSMPMTGAKAAGTGTHKVIVGLWRASGSGLATAYGNVNSYYFPFGGAGGNTLGPTSGPSRDSRGSPVSSH